MKNSKQNLPEMTIETCYTFGGRDHAGSSTSTNSDPTTLCTTSLTTTHFDRK